MIDKKVRVYDLAKELKQDTKRIIEDLCREGADVSVPSNLISKELADKISNKYFPKVETTPKRAIKVIKKKAVKKVKKEESPTAETAAPQEEKSLKVEQQKTEKVETPVVEEEKPKTSSRKVKILTKKVLEEKAEEKTAETDEENISQISSPSIENNCKEFPIEGLINSQRQISSNILIDKLKVDCRECVKPTKHNLIFTVQIADIENKKEYQIVECMGCESISFRRIIFKNGNQLNSKGEIDLYPSRLIGRRKLELDSIPSTIALTYEEIHLALSNKLLVLATIGMRTLIELVCNDHGSNTGNLMNKIDDLMDKKLLTSKNANNLHQLRYFGNGAAHEADIQSEDTLYKCMDIIEHLLKDIYSPEISN